MAGNTRAMFFPFDLFGGGGAAAGTRLLADAFREMLADNRREKIPTRARAYAGKVQVEEFPFETLADYKDWQSQARQAVRKVLDKNDFLIWAGGNHLALLPVYQELAAKDTLVVQLDAHLDIYNLSDCTRELSHGNFLLHLEKKLPAIINVGHRELLLRQEYIGKYYTQAHSAADLAIDPGPVLQAVRRACDSASRVFLDLDCDVFDPAYFPAIPHPVPFGLSPDLVLRVLDAAWSGRAFGIGISEFDPARDRNDLGLETLMWLLEYLLLRRYEGQPPASAGG